MHQNSVHGVKSLKEKSIRFDFNDDAAAAASGIAACVEVVGYCDCRLHFYSV